MKRTRIGIGIYRTAYGFAVIWRDRGRNREKHFPPDTPLAVVKAWRQRARAQVMLDQGGARPSRRGA